MTALVGLLISEGFGLEAEEHVRGGRIALLGVGDSHLGTGWMEGRYYRDFF